MGFLSDQAASVKKGFSTSPKDFYDQNLKGNRYSTKEAWDKGWGKYFGGQARSDRKKAADKTRTNLSEAIQHTMDMFKRSLALRKPYRDMGARALEYARANIGPKAPLEGMMRDYGSAGVAEEMAALGMGDRTGAASDYFGEKLDAGGYDRRTGRLRDLIDISQGLTSRGAGLATASGSRQAGYGAAAGNLAAQNYLRAADARDAIGAGLIYGLGRGLNDEIAYDAYMGGGRSGGGGASGGGRGGYSGQTSYNDYMRSRGYL